jgi:transcription initiation factor IIE alpha subunit
MDEEATDYLKTSPFYQLLSEDGAVGLMDALLRKHYDSLTATEYATVTGYDVQKVERLLALFEEKGLVRMTDEGVVVLQKESEGVQAFRTAQTSLL